MNMSKEFPEVYNPKSEQEKKIFLRMLLQRHGPKASSVGEKNLLADDFVESVTEGFGVMNLQEGIGLVRVTSSPVSRAVETAKVEQALLQDSEHRGKENDFIPTKETLETPYQPEYEEMKFVRDLERIAVLQEAFLQVLQAEYEDDQVGLKSRIDTEVLKILFDPIQSEEHGFEHTSKEVADKLAQRYQHFLVKESLITKLHDTSTKQPEDEPYTQIDVTHSFSIMSLLKEYLVFADGMSAREMTGEEFLERTGGVIPESSSLELLYKSGGIIEVKGGFFPGKAFAGTLEITN
jgi:hypothetical protein